MDKDFHSIGPQKVNKTVLTVPYVTFFTQTFYIADACDPNEFHCWTGNCINGTLQCDGHEDCIPDGADEAECSSELGLLQVQEKNL